MSSVRIFTTLLNYVQYLTPAVQIQIHAPLLHAKQSEKAKTTSESKKSSAKDGNSNKSKSKDDSKKDGKDSESKNSNKTEILNVQQDPPIFRKQGNKYYADIRVVGIDKLHITSITVMSSNNVKDEENFTPVAQATQHSDFGSGKSSKDYITVLLPVTEMKKSPNDSVFSIKFEVTDDGKHKVFYTEGFVFDEENDNFILERKSSSKWGWVSITLLSVAGVLALALLIGIVYACFMRE